MGAVPAFGWGGVLGGAVLAAALAACASEAVEEKYTGDKKALGPDQKTYPADCGGLDEAEGYACAQQRFWIAFRTNTGRAEALALMQSVLARTTDEASTARVPRAELLFRVGQLKLAMAQEQLPQNPNLAVESGADFERSYALHANPKVPPWTDTVDFIRPLFTGNRDELVRVFDRAEKNTELLPVANILSLAGISIHLPLDSGIPQRTIALLDRWDCGGYEWCETNTWRAPGSIPGTRFLFAEAYARVGDREKTVEYLERARTSPGFDGWPYRRLVDEALADVDGFLARFSAVAPNQPTMTQSYASATYSCLMCHGEKGHVAETL
jgi:hypothetical protein